MNTHGEKSLIQTIPIPPGETVREYMDFFALTMDDFAQRLGVSKQTLARIYRGDQPITVETANKLACVTGVDESFWLRLEANYQVALLREHQAQKMQYELSWIAQFPLHELQKRNFLSSNYAKLKPEEQLRDFLNFFQMSSVDAYKQRLNENLFAARTTKGTDSDRFSIEAWVQMGVRLAHEQKQNISIQKYDKVRLLELLGEIKKLSLKLQDSHFSPKDFLLEIRQLLQSAGVLIVYLKKIKGVNKVSGVVRWLDNNPVIILSLNKQEVAGVIFSLFHEIGHIVKHGKVLSYVSCGEKTQEEREADEFAAQQLIDKRMEEDLLKTPFNLSAFAKFASRANVSIDIIIGRYRYLKDNWKRPLLGFTPRKISWEDLDAWTF